VRQNSHEVKMIFSAQCCYAKCRGANMEHFCTVSLYDNWLLSSDYKFLSNFGSQWWRLNLS